MELSATCLRKLKITEQRGSRRKVWADEDGGSYMKKNKERKVELAE